LAKRKRLGHDWPRVRYALVKSRRRRTMERRPICALRTVITAQTQQFRCSKPAHQLAWSELLCRNLEGDRERPSAQRRVPVADVELPVELTDDLENRFAAHIVRGMSKSKTGWK
jgi:hypothetical protein